jgi:GAF domain-containing protein
METILAHKIPLAVSDAHSDPLLEPLYEIMQQYILASVLLAPVIIPREVVGTLGIGYFENHEFSQSVQSLLKEQPQ